jgi:hypothetical protein
MLTAILGGLGDILRVAVVALERFALLLERTRWDHYGRSAS